MIEINTNNNNRYRNKVTKVIINHSRYNKLYRHRNPKIPSLQLTIVIIQNNNSDNDNNKNTNNVVLLLFSYNNSFTINNN